jgi:hypothetical protein
MAKVQDAVGWVHGGAVELSSNDRRGGRFDLCDSLGKTTEIRWFSHRSRR